MKRHHQELLGSTHEFLVNEMPMKAILEAIKDKGVLTRHDFDQLRSLNHQGRRALARYFLGVLPHRGGRAFPSFLDALQEANAQHIVDLLLAQAGATTMTDLIEAPGSDETPSPAPFRHDPHEYAVRLTRNNQLIRKYVDPAKVSPVLQQNKVITDREADTVFHLHGKGKKWDLMMTALLQRGERAYQAFLAALLQNEYNSVFHTIQETSVGRFDSDDDVDEDTKPDPDTDTDKIDDDIRDIPEGRQLDDGTRSLVGSSRELYSVMHGEMD